MNNDLIFNKESSIDRTSDNGSNSILETNTQQDVTSVADPITNQTLKAINESID